MASAAIEETAGHLAPLQLDFRVKGGCEAVIHVASHIFHLDDTPAASKWVLQIDFKNTFNCINHDFLFREVREHVPQLSAWLERCYGTQAFGTFGKEQLLS